MWVFTTDRNGLGSGLGSGQESEHAHQEDVGIYTDTSSTFKCTAKGESRRVEISRIVDPIIATNELTRSLSTTERLEIGRRMNGEIPFHFSRISHKLPIMISR